MSPRRVLIFLLAATALVALGIYAWGLLPKPENNRIVILVGLDGFRSDYLQKFQPPVLSKLAAEGVTTSRMIPSFPSLTFPNLYTLVTGLRPARHGIVGNSMYDPEFDAKFSLGSPAVKEGRWWGGEPVWITAERQGIRSACMFWPGSEAEIQGRRPHDWRDYDGAVTAEKRVATVLEWLGRPEAERPRLVTLYFHEADSAGHKYGPDAPETAAAVKVVDLSLGQLVAGIRQLGLEDRVHLICVADHGMTEVSPDRVINLAELIDLKTTDVDSTGAVSGLRPKEETPEALVAKLNQPGARFKAYLANDVPAHWHFRNHRRIPPVVLVADEGWSIVRKPVRTEEERRTFLKATHGFPPELPSMGAIFIARGPSYLHGVTVPEFANTEVYALICATLGIEPAANDGTASLPARVLVR